MKYVVLYNPLSGGGNGKVNAEKVRALVSDAELTFTDVREVKDLASFFASLAPEDAVVLTGGDGTLNHFVNDLGDLEVVNPLYLFAGGSGNDFRTDVAPGDEGLIPLNKYVKDLPIVKVNGMTRRFINGVGYGIDGYCCEEGDRLAKESSKPVNYASIAVKGLLFHYHTTHATVTVDGETHEFDRVWLAPTMKGRYYGGGMMAAPAQDRFDPDGKLTTVVWYGSGKLKTLMAFSSIFQGKHVEHTDMVSVFTGNEITVRFDRPTALQIDGKTVSGVTEYQVSSGKAKKAGKKEAETAAV